MGILRNIYGSIVTGAGNLITRALERGTGETYGRTTREEFLESRAGRVLSTAAAVTTVGIGGTAALTNPALIGQTLRAVTPKTIVGKAAGILIGGAALASPTVRKTIAGTPKFLGEKGYALGKEIEGLPDEEKGKAGTVLGLVGGALVGGAVTAAVSKIKEGKEAVEEVIGDVSIGNQGGIADIQGLTPETVDVSPKPKKTYKKKPKEAPQQKISQSVRVTVSPIIKQSQSRKYLNVIKL